MDIGVLSIFQNYGDEEDDAAIMRGELAIARLAEELGYDSYWARALPGEVADALRQRAAAARLRAARLLRRRGGAGEREGARVRQVVAKIERQREILGSDIDVLAITKYGGMTDAEAVASMRLFAHDVMPSLRATSNARSAAG
jgi:hypothetical protein